MRREVAPSLLAAFSQASGFGVIVVLLAGGGPTISTDAYFYLLTWTQSAYQLLLASWLYPVWLRGDGLSGKNARLIALLSPFAVTFVALAAAVLFQVIAGPAQGIRTMAVLFAAQGMAASVYWVMAFWLSASGDPLWIASGGALPNTLAVLAGALVLGASAEFRVTLVIGVQCIGWLIAIGVVYLRRPAVWQRIRAWAPMPESTTPGQAGAWYLAQGVAGYGSILGLQSFVATLPTQSLSVMGVLYRVQGGLTGVVTNANLPRLVNSGSASGAKVQSFLTRFVITITFAIVGLAIALRAGLEGSWPVYAGLIVTWFAAGTLNVAAKRVGARFLSPRFALTTIAASILIPAGLLLMRDQWSFTLLLAAYVALEAVPGIVYALALRWYRQSVAFAVVIVVGLVIFSSHIR